MKIRELSPEAQKKLLDTLAETIKWEPVLKFVAKFGKYNVSELNEYFDVEKCLNGAV